MMEEPLSGVDALKLIKSILGISALTLSKHAIARLSERRMNVVDVTNVLMGGRVDSIDLEDGSWRYRVSTPHMSVVVAFRSETEMRVVTGWRNT
jgi:hypothetical protein